MEFEERLNRTETLEDEGNGCVARLLDAADHDGDAVLALKRAREACALDSIRTPDAAKRLVASLRRRRENLGNESIAETQTKEVLSFTQICRTAHAGDARGGRHWVAANAWYWRRSLE